MAELKFGYWPRKLNLDVGSVVIRAVETFEPIREAMASSERIIRGWYYPPLSKEGIYERGYALPLTHTLRMPNAPDAKECADFMIALLGMLEGIRLLPEGWIHFYRSAVQRQFSDVVCDGKEIELVLQIGSDFWNRVNEEVRQLIFGAIHWRSFVESYEQEFERFQGHYMVLDACYKLYRLLNTSGPCANSHATRPNLLATRYSMEVPVWAETRKINGKEESDLSQLRNELVHEARYAGKPIAFGYPKWNGSIDLELGHFNTRLILAMLGVKSVYVRSAVGTRQCYPLGLDP